MIKCKVCGVEISEHVAFSEIADEGDTLYVVRVGDNDPIILRAGDSLCTHCHSDAIWYKRMDLPK